MRTQRCVISQACILTTEIHAEHVLEQITDIYKHWVNHDAPVMIQNTKWAKLHFIFLKNKQDVSVMFSIRCRSTEGRRTAMSTSTRSFDLWVPFPWRINKPFSNSFPSLSPGNVCCEYADRLYSWIWNWIPESLVAGISGYTCAKGHLWTDKTSMFIFNRHLQ